MAYCRRDAKEAQGSLGAGGSIWSGLLGSNAAKEAEALQSNAYMSSRNTLQQGQVDALNYLDPFRQLGLNVGGSFQDALYSSEQWLNQIADQRAQLQREVDRLWATPELEQVPYPHWADGE